MVVSLHATKVFGIGGGRRRDLSRSRVARSDSVRLTNFGFYGQPPRDVSGDHAKVSEYAAAIGLAAFDMWPAARTKSPR